MGYLTNPRFWLGAAMFVVGFGVAAWWWITRPADID